MRREPHEQAVDDWLTDSPKVWHWERDRDRVSWMIYVGRPSIWGNPFKIGPDGTRDEVIEKYRAWLLAQPELMSKLPELRGRHLACWCAPLACHADVLLELANVLPQAKRRLRRAGDGT